MSLGIAVIAKVAVEKTAYHFDKPYDYLVPKQLQLKAKQGVRVMVPFGTGNRKRQGIILGFASEGEVEKLKPIVAVLDKEPVLNAELLRLAEWISEHAFCTLYDAVHLLLPAGINMRIIASYTLADSNAACPDDLTKDELRVLDCIRSSKATVERDRLLEVMGLADSRIPDKLCERGLLLRTDDAVRRMGDATVRMVRLSASVDGVKLTEKQRLVVDLLSTAGSASVKEVCYFTGVTQAVVTGLIKKGVLEAFENIVYRTPTLSSEVEADGIELTAEQQAAFDALNSKLRDGIGGAGLLYGVTGSGKTQVFLRLVDEAVAMGKGVIVMVPEISLTPQTLSKFHRRYGDKVAVFHSAMPLGQRMDEWRRVKSGDALVAIGTRSAVFAPFENLGLIIMDEEQEHTYKSEATPRFHARDVARFRCGYNNALLVLASATPSVESYSAALSGRYTLCTLENRYGNAKLPKVHTVDMRNESKDGNLSPISRFLQQKLAENLENGKQSILLLNRRGHNTIIKCTGCGNTVSCPNCSITLTYHSANKRMLCHYCGYSEPFAQKCAVCGNERMRYNGFGTQRAEEELGILFPTARILRMDADSTMTRGSYETKLGDFAAHKYDIMLGTQMVAKGLDFPDVTLVGVLNADNSLYSEDYRSYERTFSLLTQVVGRSGRGDEAGIAVVQTLSPDNEIISLAAAQDYGKFYEQEIAVRKALIYPPYCSVCLVGFVGDKMSDAMDGAGRFVELLKCYRDLNTELKLIVLGPSPAAVSKVGGKYRARLIIKVKNNRAFRLMMRDALRSFMRNPLNKNVTVFADVNSESNF